MAFRTSRNIARDRRRALVARLLVRNPRITQLEIKEELATGGKNGEPLIVNPETDKPYAVGTINGDVKAIRKEFRERAARDGDDWISELISRYDEIYRTAMEEGDLTAANKANDSISKIVGAYAPERHQAEVTTNMIQIIGADPDKL